MHVLLSSDFNAIYALELLLRLVLRQAVHADDAYQPSAGHRVRVRLVSSCKLCPLQQVTDG